MFYESEDTAKTEGVFNHLGISAENVCFVASLLLKMKREQCKGLGG
jgi:hypothetical protein